ncbi:hydrolase [Salinibacter sp. 10B]|uniref:carbohydrate binding family 9 domain-containing protein n=1 Tax=Salinibacter sp. 10B TaxID=1923971 RepID=UPI000CF4A666|nr:carbohydrate binding family 9 domain-containing protein [Salinibacter sp. 10B]PQJ35350.1 hydrolase [Salinibacter sp. 10B]
MVRSLRFLVVLLLLHPLSVLGQDAPRQIKVNYISGNITVDGAMDEAVWSQADVATNFWQFFPTDTARAEHPTQMRMLYNETTLYVAARAEVPEDDYVVSTLRRDFSGTTSDNITVMFDTYRNGTNAYLFGVNPYGVKREALISGGGDEGGDFNDTWDEKWRAESRRHDDQYVVEMAIPFSSLSYPEGSRRWRFQGYRWDFQVNERSVWSRVPQNQLMINLGFLGEMVFERPLGGSSSPIAVIPYVNTGTQRDFVPGETDNQFRMGGDAKVDVGQGLTLDLTVNPDFSNVEADEFVTNVTRFEISRPEKRQFFIDNNDLFQFGSPFQDDVPFFSRRIGIARDSTGRFVENRILGGARLSGNLSEDWRLGVLNIQTDENSGLQIPSNNNAMVALKRRVFARSTVGAFFINRQTVGDYGFVSPEEEYNRVLGLDYNLATSDNVWTGTFYLHKSFQPDDYVGNYSAQSLLQYNTRTYSGIADFVYVGQDYQSDLGFIPRKDIFKSGKSISRTFWPESGLVNNHTVDLTTVHYWRPNLDFKLTDQHLRAGWSAEFADQSSFEVEYSNRFVFLTNGFDPTRSDDGAPLPGDRGFRFNQITSQYESDSSNDFYFNAESTVGGFFNGNRYSFGGQLNLNVQPWAVLSMGANYDRIRLPDPYADADLWLLTPEADITFSKSLFWSTLVQYSTQRNTFGVNSRLQWRFAPLSDLYLVYNDNYFTDRFSPRRRSLTLKLTYWLNL